MAEEIETTRESRLITADRLAWGAALFTLIGGVGGFLLNNLFRYESEPILRQVRVVTFLTLFILLPLLLLGLWRSASRTAVGKVTVLGVLMSIAYFYFSMIMSLPVNTMTLVHIWIIGLAFWALIFYFKEMDTNELAASLGRNLFYRAGIACLLLAGGFVIFRWFDLVINLTSAYSTLNKYNITPGVLIDLSIIAPLFIVTGYLSLRQEASGVVLGTALLIFFAIYNFATIIIPFMSFFNGNPFNLTPAVPSVIFFVISVLLLIPVYRAKQETILVEQAGATNDDD